MRPSIPVSLSSTSVNATEVTYTETFTATHALEDQGSTVTLTAPAGTTFPEDACSYTFSDNTTLSGGGCPTVAVSVVNRSITFTAQTKVQSASLGLSNPTHGTSGVTYTVNFTATNALTAGHSTLTFIAPSGTTLPTEYYEYEVEDVTTSTNGNAYTTPTVSGGGNEVTLITNTNVAAGDQVTFRITKVTNDGTTGLQDATFATSSDPLSATLPFTLT